MRLGIAQASLALRSTFTIFAKCKKILTRIGGFKKQSMKIVAFYGKATRLVKQDQFEELLEAVGAAWGESVKAGFFFAKDLAERLRRDFPELAERYLRGDENVFGDVLPAETDLLVCLVGDGTMLDTLPLVQDSGIPVLGINFGRLGFLNAINADRVQSLLQPGFIDRFRKERRLLLEVGDFEFLSQDSISVPSKLPYALNEAAVVKSENESLVLLDVLVDGQFMNTSYGDGVLFSTPTGSTAYSLRCGGPILIPSADNILITPMASHTLTVRPLIIEGYQEVTVRAKGTERCRLLLDSKVYELAGPFSFKIRKAGFKFITVYPPERNFFDAIREKLMWGFDVRHKRDC